MRRILILAWNDLWLTLKDRPVVFWMVVMPVGFIYAMGFMGGASQTPRIALTVVDEDQTFISRAFTEALDREGFVVQHMTAAERDTTERIRRCVDIPRGFEDSLMIPRQVSVYFYVDPDASSEASLTAEMHVQRAVFQTLIDLTATARGGTTDETFERIFAEVAAEARNVVVQAETAGCGRPVPSGMRASLPAMLTLFMLVNTGIYGAIYLAEERQERILARMASLPLGRAQILAGKLLGRTLIALFQAAILLLIGRFLLGAYLGNSLVGLILLVLCLALAVAAMALFWGAVLRRPEQVMAVTLVVSLFLAAIGGCWWPLEVVPAWMRVAGHVSPAAWAMDGFHAIISFGSGAKAVLLPCLILLGYAAVFTSVGARLLGFRD